MKNKLYLLMCCIGMSGLTASAQIITTKAGQTTGGYSGDGGAATAAKLWAPAGVALDGAGNVYVADEYNNCIRKIAASGTISTVAGNDTAGYSGDSSAATAARLNHPTCVIVDAAGNLYIADKENDVIRKVSSAGIIYTIAGNGMRGFGGDGDTATEAMLNRPTGLALDGNGNLYIADQYNNRIRKVNTSGIITTMLGNGWGGYNGDNFPAATMASLNKPSGVTIGPDGNIYVADTKNDRVRMYDAATAKISTVKGKSGTPPFNEHNLLLESPSSVAFDKVGNMYVADQYHYVVKKVDSNGSMYTIAGTTIYGFSGEGVDAKSAKLSLVKSIAVDSAGNLYMADADNNRIRYVTTTVGVGNVKRVSADMTVYPNPTSTGRFELNLRSMNNEKATVIISDVAGKVVYTATAATNQPISVNLDQPAGIYLVTAESAEVVWAGKINIVH